MTATSRGTSGSPFVNLEKELEIKRKVNTESTATMIL